MSAYHFKYFPNIQFKNHGIAPTPPDLPTLKAYPTPGVGGRFEIFSLKWRERMNLKVPGAILPLGCAILSTRAITVRGGCYNPPLGELGLMPYNTLAFTTNVGYGSPLSIDTKISTTHLLMTSWCWHGKENLKIFWKCLKNKPKNMCLFVWRYSESA